jgi:two-component system CheB/CheR fusion protein
VVYDKDNKPFANIAFFRDITDEKKAQKELKEKEEMMLIQSKQAAMGDMIAMIAHQWRQPITVISMAANNLKLSLELEEEITTEALKKMLTSVTYQTQHLSKTIDDFRNFFKPDKKKETVTVKEVLDNTLQIIGKSLENHDITLEINDRAPSTITILANELIQVLLNILNNAKDALIQNAIESARITINMDETEHFVNITICDNAGGIPDSAITRLGEPYFSTKGKNGTGLGVYMSKTIMEQHFHGQLSWKNVEEGACFTATLPKEST